MEKDFDEWNVNKKILHTGAATPFYHAREIWWCSLGVNVGFEQDGTGKNFDRPVVVLKGFSKDVCLVVALTGKKKEGRYYFYLGAIDGTPSSAILSQVRLVDVKRFVRKLATLDEKTFSKLQTILIEVLFDRNSLPPQKRGRGRSHL